MPTYATEEDKPLFERVYKIVRSIEERRKVQFSIPTQVLIVNMLSAIRNDPSPYWVENESMRLELYENTLNGLAKTLNQFLNEENIKGNVTFYDAMHWLTQNLNSICPFQKLDKPVVIKTKEPEYVR